ncbi:MAG: hypothetical protein WBC73_12630 [Phormidesmis sp.]
MPRKKRNSRTLEKAENRLSGVQAIDEKLELSSTLTAQQYSKRIANLRQKINTYNRTLSEIDQLQNEIDVAERDLADYSEQMLLGVAAKFGKNSNEYEKAGGVRKSDRISLSTVWFFSLKRIRPTRFRGSNTDPGNFDCSPRS